VFLGSYRPTLLAVGLLALPPLTVACADDGSSSGDSVDASDDDSADDDSDDDSADDDSDDDSADDDSDDDSADDDSDDDSADDDSAVAVDDDSDDDAPSSVDAGSTDAGSSSPAPSTTQDASTPPDTSFCAPAADRIDPATIALDNDAFVSLGHARTGIRAVGTAQENETLRYVSAANGSDNGDGSADAPWRSLQQAADEVSPGTTVLVDASGPYEPFEIYAGGDPGAYVIFKNQDDGQMPLIEGDPSVTSLVYISASYIVLQGFEIANHPGDSLDKDTLGIEIEPDGADLSFIEIRGNWIHDIGPTGLEDNQCYYNGHGILASAEGEAISNLTISGNEINDMYVGNSEVLVVNGNVDNFCVSSNFIHDVNNIAIDIIGYEQNNRETARQGQVVDNVVLDASNYFPYCSRGNCTYPPGDESSDGIYVDGGAELDIAYNIVGRADHGIELQSENGQLIRDVEVHDNLVFNSNYRNLTVGEVENSSEHDNVLIDEPDLANAELEGCK
jgi:hypothetical protein